jgi:Ankyrin repeats (3 copies)
MPNKSSKKSNGFVKEVLAAAKCCDLERFNTLMDQKNSSGIQALFASADLNNNNIFHYLLIDDSSRSGRRKRRHIRAHMCHRLLDETNALAPLNASNNQRETPLHLAIMRGYDNIVDRMLKKDVDITPVNNENQTALELAAIRQKNTVYKKLLKKHTDLNTQALKSEGYTCAQLVSAQKVYLGHLRRKQVLMGILGSALAIACPLGAVLAFNELPLLTIMFSTLIPGIGPIIGAVGAVVFGGLLLWSMYKKSSNKYGAHAQESVEMDGKVAQIKYLEAGLRGLNYQYAHDKNMVKQKEIQGQRVYVIQELKKLYDTIEDVQPRYEAKDADWATATDKFRAEMLTAGTFLCSFSGILGIIGVGSSYLPIGMMATACFVGIPVIGWAALGIALAIGIGVATWSYHAKYKPTLTECGKAKQALHEKKIELCKQKTVFNESTLTLVRHYGMQTLGNVLQSKEDGSVKKLTTAQTGVKKPGDGYLGGSDEMPTTKRSLKRTTTSLSVKTHLPVADNETKQLCQI